MVSKSLVAFSRITEQFLFFNLDQNLQPRVQRSYIIKTTIYFLLILKLLRLVTIDNEDVTQHIRHGNFFVGLTRQSDLLTVPSLAAVLAFAAIMSYHIYLLRYRPQSLLFMTKVAGARFEEMSEKQQRSVLSVAQVLMYASRALCVSIACYATFAVIATNDVTLYAKWHLVAVATAAAYCGQNAVMACYVITICTGLCCSYVSRRLDNAFLAMLDERKAHKFNAVCMITYKLNGYWKYVNFMFVVCTAIATTVFLSVAFLYDSLPTFVTISYILLMISFSTMYSLVVLSAAYVHSKVKSRYNHLIQIFNLTRAVQPRKKLNHLLKMFEHLIVFTLADAAVITFDTYREVSYEMLCSLTSFHYRS